MLRQGIAAMNKNDGVGKFTNKNCQKLTIHTNPRNIILTSKIGVDVMR